MTRWVVTVLCALAVALPAASARGSSAPDPATAAQVTELVQAAQEARTRGELDAAYGLLERAHALYPDPNLRYNMAVVRRDQGRYAEAYALFERIDDDGARAQLDLLKPKLVNASIVVELEPGAALSIDGVPAADPDRERTVAPGAHVLEVRGADGREVALVVASFEVGRLTRLELGLKSPAPEEGWIALDGLPGGVEVLAIDGYPLGLGEGERRVRRVRVAAGERRVEPRGGPELPARTVRVEPGRTASLTLSVAAEPGEAPSQLGPALTTGAGVALVVAAVVMLVSAEGDRSDVEVALETRPVSGMTMSEAVTKQDRANALSAAGVAVGAAGGATVAGGLLWWGLQ